MAPMLRLFATLLTIIVVLGTAGVIAAYVAFARDINADVERLVNEAKPSGIIVTDAMLSNLPAPAQRYLRHAGVVGQPIPRLVRLTQKGRIRASATTNWMTFEADETYSTNSPAFVWHAAFPSPLMPMVQGRDEYVAGEGSIQVRALSLFPIADEHGDEMRAAGLMRYLNEAMWFPAVLLGSNVTIAAADADSFQVTLTDRGLTARAVLSVDALGRLTNFRAQRFEINSGEVQTWETPISSYGVLNGLQLPTGGSAIWKLPAGDLDYIELTITSLKHEN